MTNLYSYGYTPNTKAEERKKEMEYLCRNFGIILKNFNTVLENENYFFCEIGNAFLSMPYIAAGGHIPLGVLVLLWKEGNLIRKCPSCDGKLYVMGCGGSPLSGSCNWWGICCTCREEKSQEGDSGFSSFFVPVHRMMKRYLNESIIQKGKRQYFSWKDGLAGETTPDIIIKEKTKGVNVKTLIKELPELEL